MMGLNAVRKAAEVKPDLILLDLNLPDTHGSEVLKLLLEEPLTRHIPVIIVSADAMPHQLVKLLKLGAKSYLTKPFNVDQFLMTINQFLLSDDSTTH